MKPKKIIDATGKEIPPVDVIMRLLQNAYEFIVDFWNTYYMKQFYTIDEIIAAIDELDHITLGKIDYYKHTDYERDLLIATVMKR